MEDTKSRPGAPSERAQIAAEKLRALRERANDALNEHRRRLSQIESELGLRIRQLAEEYESASASANRQGLFGRDDEVAALRRQLEEGRAKHEKFVEQLAFARRQLDAIQNQPCAACHDAAQQIAEAHSEIRQLHEKLDAADRQRHEDRTRHEKLATQIAEARQKLAELQASSGADTSSLHEEIASLKKRLDGANLAKANAEAEAAVLQRDAAALSAEYDSLQSQCKRQENEHEHALGEARTAAQAEIDRLKARTVELEAELIASDNDGKEHCDAVKALEAKLSEAEKREAAWAGERDAWGKERSELEAALEEAKLAADAREQTLSSELTSARAEVTRLSAELKERDAENDGFKNSLAAAKQEIETLKAAEAKSGERQKSESAELAARLKQAESEKAAAEASLADVKEQGSALRESLTTAHEQLETLKASNADAAELQRQLDEATASIAARDRAVDEEKARSEAIQRELSELRESTCPRSELEGLEHKFQLALADVQKLKKENGGLREELATRPEASESESPELVALRAERDMLATRIEELEAAATATAGEPSQQELEDLHRRFEMAVEDVRELKQENAKLQEQLAKAKPAGADSGASGGKLDWAAQKARLLAALAEEEVDGTIDHERKKERLSIQDTIEATDRALADKDEELARLRAEHDEALANRGPNAQQQTAALLDADEVIAQERGRLAELQSEWEQKLRTAELEMSVERAKLAREQAVLKERLFELDKLGPPSSEDPGKPRRRWLAALGLHEEAEDAAKKPR